MSAWSKYVRKNKVRVAPFQDKTEDNAKFCNFLWRYLNSTETAHDSRLRWATFDLYKSIWGYDTPACLTIVAKRDIDVFMPTIPSPNPFSADHKSPSDSPNIHFYSPDSPVGIPLVLPAQPLHSSGSSINNTISNANTTSSNPVTIPLVNPLSSPPLATGNALPPPVSVPPPPERPAKKKRSKRKAPEYEASYEDGILKIVFLKRQVPSPLLSFSSFPLLF